MSNNVKWVDQHIEVDPPKRPKKITGTRLAAIFGLNKWNTPFKTWAEITKTYQEPFEDTKFTIAGKVIEPKQAEYVKKAYHMTNLKTPTDLFGPDYFNRTYGDFFHEHPILGGMFDFLEYNSDGKPVTVLEMKTTQRSEDWQNDIPEYYAIQAALYAYLLGVDDVIMVASFLAPADYDHPEDFVPSVNNTILVEFTVSERYPAFQQMIDEATTWWNKHVVTGVSPDYDEKADADILKALRTNSLSPQTDVNELISEAEQLKTEIDLIESTIADKKKRLDKLTDMVKEYAIKQFRDGDKKVEINGKSFTFAVSRSEGKPKLTYDENAMKADGVYEKYVSETPGKPSYRMTVNIIKASA